MDIRCQLLTNRSESQSLFVYSNFKTFRYDSLNIYYLSVITGTISSNMCVDDTHRMSRWPPGLDSPEYAIHGFRRLFMSSRIFSRLSQKEDLIAQFSISSTRNGRTVDWLSIDRLYSQMKTGRRVSRESWRYPFFVLSSYLFFSVRDNSDSINIRWVRNDNGQSCT